ncbi:hypothetical protein AB0L40_14235 [Patulibacter sp. NPDC049589]|uniref:hypothetical protein n=1 Tax=Patulibacter sp. NPDC049589 TaxID=3154731 RepID=UPI00341DD172
MPATATRSRLAVLAIVAASLAALPAAATADASAVRPTNVASRTVAEGQTATLRIKLTCQRGYGPCDFRIDAVALTATRPGDFAARTSPVRSKLKIRRAGRSMVATVAFTATDDAVCEGAEVARVRVLKHTRRKGSRRDYGLITIQDDDCATPPAPQPVPAPPATPTPTPAPEAGPAPAFPADSGTPTVRTVALADGSLAECTTPQWIGTEAAGGVFQPGCAVAVACPPEARTCNVRAESRHTLERAVGEDRVSLNSRITTFSAGGVAFFHRDGSSAGVGFTRNEDPGVIIRGGESARVECNGVRIAPSAPNRSQIGCSLTLERLS